MYIYIYILIPHLYANAYQLRRLRFLWRNGPWPNSGPRGPPGAQGKPGPPGTPFPCFISTQIQIFTRQPGHPGTLTSAKKQKLTWQVGRAGTDGKRGPEGTTGPPGLKGRVVVLKELVKQRDSTAMLRGSTSV
jgi:hypothetical protein